MGSEKRPNRYHCAQFIMGAHRLSQLPDDTGVEVAFAGRSNAGKSSALNAISGIKSLARTSKTPGRTQQINLFHLDDERRLVDLPGYGFAKVPEAVKRQWQHTLERYLVSRRALRGLVMVLDIRRHLTEGDRQMLDWCRHAGMPVHLLLTKADKLKRGPATDALRRMRATLATDYPHATAQLFSALKGQGLDEARALLDQWFGYDTQPPEAES